MQQIIVKPYNDNYKGIEVINDIKLQVNEDYLKLLYKRKIIKKPYNKNIGSGSIIFYAKKEYVNSIKNRLDEHYKNSKID